MGWFGLGQYDAHDRRATIPVAGVGRFFYLLLRDLWEYVKANLLCCLCCLPSVAAGGILLLTTRNYFLCAGAALLLSPMAGAGFCGLHRVVNRAMRGKQERTGAAFSKGFRDNFRAAIVPGILAVLQMLLVGYMLLFRAAINAFPMPVRLWALLLLCWLFLQILLQYCFPLLVVLALPLRHLLRNSLILFIGNFKKSLLCLLLATALDAAGVLLLPKSLIVIGTMGLSVTTLIRQFFSWNSIDSAFSIESRQEGSQDG